MDLKHIAGIIVGILGLFVGLTFWINGLTGWGDHNQERKLFTVSGILAVIIYSLMYVLYS